MPTGLHVVRVSASSFTVAAKASAHRYRMFVSTVHSDLTVANLAAARKSKLSRKPRLTVTGLPFTTAPYYYRFEALNGSKGRYSAMIGSIGLRPAAPTNLVATASITAGTSLTWTSGPATGFTITQATDAAMTQDLRTYTTTGPDQQFTPYGLIDGTTYYFQVKALNGSTASANSNIAPATAMTAEQPVTAMTYNILEATFDGGAEGGQTVAPWSQRRIAAAALINRANPDVVAIQEGAAWVGAVKGPRQVDDLVSALDGEYSLADTETPPSEKHYFRTGCYILYKTGEYQAVGAGGHWSLGDNRWAAYQVLQNLGTGAQFLFVSPHLLVTKGAANDTKRADETTSLLAQANDYATLMGVPVMYAGDFNSVVDGNHTFDGPGIAMRAANVDDSFDVAQLRTNAQYNSANQYERTPPAFGDRIDYVFAPPGVAVTSWKMMVDLTHGKFAGTIPSDHNPVVASLLVPYQQPTS